MRAVGPGGRPHFSRRAEYGKHRVRWADISVCQPDPTFLRADRNVCPTTFLRTDRNVCPHRGEQCGAVHTEMHCPRSLGLPRSALPLYNAAMPYRCLADFLEELSHAGELTRVENEVDPAGDVAEIVAECPFGWTCNSLRGGQGARSPVLGQPAGHRRTHLPGAGHRYARRAGRANRPAAGCLCAGRLVRAPEERRAAGGDLAA